MITWNTVTPDTIFPKETILIVHPQWKYSCSLIWDEEENFFYLPLCKCGCEEKDIIKNPHEIITFWSEINLPQE